VAVLDDVVLGLGAGRVAGQAAALLEPLEAGGPPCDDLVDVGLVPGVPQDGVGGRVEDPVQREGELDDAEVGPEVAAGARDRADQEGTDLGGEGVELRAVEPAEVLRAVQRVQQTHRAPPRGRPRAGTEACAGVVRPGQV
jgi:hypothetical protein